MGTVLESSICDKAGGSPASSYLISTSPICFSSLRLFDTLKRQHGQQKGRSKEEGGNQTKIPESNIQCFLNVRPESDRRVQGAFTLIDANRDGFICGEDLIDIYASLGKYLCD